MSTGNIVKSDFGKTKDGKDVYLYTIKNGKNVEIVVTNIGAILVKCLVKNDKGEVKDVVLGFDTVAEYEENPAFFGATVGPNANRIANAEFTIDGNKYKIDANDGKNNLHSSFVKGFHKQIWNGEILPKENAVRFTYEMPDGLIGIPGNIKMSVTYTLTPDNEIKITYDGSSDKATVLNVTNHSYFNLASHDAGKAGVFDTELWLNASHFNEIDSGAIPTGNLTEVKGTAMDFTTPHKIGERIDDKWTQMTMVKGYDHNFCVDNYNHQLQKIACAKCDGRTMEVYTDLPGVQFYSGNNMEPIKGKNGFQYDFRGAFCLETQFFPNSVNDKRFVSPIKKANEPYHSETIYKFI